MYDQMTILKFISLFSSGDSLFTNGQSFWFSDILSSKFSGEIYYNPIDNRYASKIGDRLYDIRGDITSIITHPYYRWDEYKDLSASESRRIERYLDQKYPKGRRDSIEVHRVQHYDRVRGIRS